MVDCLAALLPMVYRYGKVKEDVDRVSRLGRALRETVKNGLGWLTIYEGMLIAIPLPLVRFDGHNRLHGENEESILWHDGVREYWWHGVRVNRKMILAPETLTSGEILKTRNSEVRRVMIERYGLARFIAESRVAMLHEDIDYGGTRQLFRVDLPRSEAMLIVKVKCPSTGSQYLLQVPPTMRTCDEAIAWTFGFEKNQYQPLIET